MIIGGNLLQQFAKGLLRKWTPFIEDDMQKLSAKNCDQNLKTSRYLTLSTGLFDFDLYQYLQKYYHGESISVNVLVDNNTSKSIKKIKISGKTLAFVHLRFFNKIKK